MSFKVREVPADDLVISLRSEWADTTKRPFVRGGTAFVPVKENYPSEGLLSPRSPYQGRGYYMIGRIALIRGKKPSGEELAELTGWQKPQGVLWVKSLDGEERIPDTELLYGTAGDVIHRETGFQYLLDPSKVMFSQGNRLEKVRMAARTRAGERVADMFAGIGYFSIPIARAGAFVHAMDINPVAYGYLVANARLNHVETNLIPECGDCRSLLSGVYDRIVMGHFNAPAMVPDTLLHVHSGTELHIHSSGKVPPDIGGLIRDAGYDPVITVRTVKKTGPDRRHFVQDVVLG